MKLPFRKCTAKSDCVEKEEKESDAATVLHDSQYSHGPVQIMAYQKYIKSIIFKCTQIFLNEISSDRMKKFDRNENQLHYEKGNNCGKRAKDGRNHFDMERCEGIWHISN